MKRKEFLMKTTAACVGVSLLPTLSCSRSKKQTANQNGGTFELPELGFSYTDLAPAIDARTMEIHYSKHHAGYVKKLNVALENHVLKGKNIETICSEVTHSQSDVAVLNNGGGHYNHTLFWEILKPGGSKKPQGKLAERINKDFGSIQDFVSDFSKAAVSVFGSGWAWLVADSNGKLFVTATQNQENPLMKNVVEKSGRPLLGIDVWEHAYYLHYQNRRGAYIENFMPLVNWDIVTQKYDEL